MAKSSGPTHRAALIIFVRKPELGKVKTRLAAAVGDAEALRIYKALLRHTKIVTSEINADVFIYYHGSLEEDDEWGIDSTIHRRSQAEGGLGNKLRNAFTEVLSDYEVALVIGSDCAQLRSAHIASAINGLETYDTVIGPTLDGGYYLLGIKDLAVDLFSDMPWSTGDVLPVTISRLERNGRTYLCLDELSDIDHIKDWEMYGKSYILA
ncbi:MAG: TIGR04282 family arsenosugar biosynthesis glycosyltransferase [Bacteroidota bacterium]